MLWALSGVLLVLLAAVSAIHILGGQFTLSMHSSERYGRFFTSPVFTGLTFAAIGGAACLWRAVDLWRERFRDK